MKTFDVAEGKREADLGRVRDKEGMIREGKETLGSGGSTLLRY